MIKSIIIDDEYLAIKVLEEYAAAITNMEVIATFTDARKALAYIQQTALDLILLDIQMPYLDGFELLAQLTVKPVVIFTTARHDYAIKAYEFDVLDYLIKPVAKERFDKAITKATEYLQYKKNIITPKEVDYLMVKADYRITKINFADIIFIEGLNEYVKIHTLLKKYVVLASLKDLQQQLSQRLFIRIHKSYIIAKAAIAHYSTTEVKLTSGEKLAVGRKYKADLLSSFNK